jgi:hypothetical protein
LIAALTVARELAQVGVVATGAANAVAPVAVAVVASRHVPLTAAVAGPGPLRPEANGALRVATVPSAVTVGIAQNVATAVIVVVAVPWVKAAPLPVASPSPVAPMVVRAGSSPAAVLMVPASVPVGPSGVRVVRLAASTTAVLPAVGQRVVSVVRIGAPAPRAAASRPPARMAALSVLGAPRVAPSSALAPPLRSAAHRATATVPLPWRCPWVRWAIPPALMPAPPTT